MHWRRAARHVIHYSMYIASRSKFAAFSIGAMVITLASPIAAQTTGEQRPASSQAKRIAAITKLTPADVAAKTKIDDDALNTIITFDSSAAFHWKGAFTETIGSDEFLRAFLDRRTGEVRFQMYLKVTYTGLDWRYFQSGTYMLPTGLHLASFVVMGRKPYCAYGMCSYIEEVGFILPEAHLRELAALYRPGVPTTMRFKLFAKSGESWSDDISAAEAAGLLDAVDRYRSTHPVTG